MILDRFSLKDQVAGFEAECRISSIVYPEHYLCGWHATGTLGHFGAAAACSNLLGLTRAQTVLLPI